MKDNPLFVLYDLTDEYIIDTSTDFEHIKSVKITNIPKQQKQNILIFRISGAKINQIIPI